MKKTLVVAAGLAVLSTSAFASKARMDALNQASSNGSYYMQDNRNIWRSAAAMNDLGAHVTAEFGTDGAAGTANGGFFQSTGSLNYGLYLNDTENYGGVAAVGGAEPGRADLFLGSNNWGVRLGYESITIDNVGGSGETSEGTGFDFGVGYNMNDLGLWLNYQPAVTNTVAGSDADGEAAMNLGATYDMNDYTLFAEYIKPNDDDSAIVLGAGRTYDVNGGSMFYDVTLANTTVGDNTDTDVSVAFGAEVKASDWLTWRLSLRQSVLQTGDSEVATRDTQLGAGASLTWGGMVVDGTIRNAGSGALGTDEFLSTVSMTYMF
jgi:hypothetical protein